MGTDTKMANRCSGKHQTYLFVTLETGAHRNSLPTHNVLIRNQVHPVASCGHNSTVGNAVHGNLLMQRYWSSEQDNGCVSLMSMFGVYPVRQVLDVVMQLLNVTP